MVRYTGLIGVFVLLASLIFLMVTQTYSQDIDQKKIDEAINKGVDFLSNKGNGIKAGREGDFELTVLTLLNAGIDPKKNDILAKGIDKMLSLKLKETYRFAVVMMALEMADRYKYQSRIAEYAQALVTSQCINGQWGYPSKPDPSTPPIVTKESAELKEMITIISESGTTGPTKTKKTPPVLKKIVVKRGQNTRSEKGDNSNTQFALLGLRSAARCGIEIPKETWQDAVKWLEQNQNGGWGYAKAVPAGASELSYGSMTAAGVCGLAIAKFYLDPNLNLLDDPGIKKGLKEMASKLDFTKNTGRTDLQWHYYYIYGIERVGAVLNIEKIGDHDWYPEGVKYLLGAQAKNGSWNDSADDKFGAGDIVDTCFALLFLKQATPKLNKAIITDEKKEK